MLNPILMGSPPCAKAGADAHADEMSAVPMPALTWRRVMRWVMDFLHKNTVLVYGILPGLPP
jgi:hypothetical protein